MNEHKTDMVTVSIDLLTAPDARVDIGRQGEYGARTVKFDLKEFGKFGSGSFVLVHQRACDFAPYVVEDFDVGGTVLTWNIGELDTQVEGIGYAEIQMIRDDAIIAKSASIMTCVMGSLASAEVPHSYTQITIDAVTALAADAADYRDQASEYAGDASESAEAASGSATESANYALSASESAQSAAQSAQTATEQASYTAHPPVIGGNDNWYVWDGAEYIDSGKSSKGTKGDQGDQGVSIVSVTKTGTQGLVDTYTILFSDGSETTYTVTNGENSSVLSVNGKTGNVVLDKTDIGLDMVDNTSDTEKKNNFTGSIALDNTGFVTGGEAYSALNEMLPKSGGTMTGDITLQGDPTAALHAATKHYVDGHYVTAGKLSGSTLGSNATAEGSDTTASGSYSHAEGRNTIASSTASHAEGSYTKASSVNSHAEGWNTLASGSASHAEGSGTSAQRKSQHVFGEYNVLDATGADGTARGSYVEIVGKGTDDNSRSNARTLDWSGNEVLAGKLTVGAAPTANMDVATKQYVDTGLSGKQNKITTSGVLIGDGSDVSAIADGTVGQVFKMGSSGPEWGSDAGGHAIKNPSGTTMTQRDTLKFIHSAVSDANSETVVGPEHPVVPVTAAEYAAMVSAGTVDPTIAYLITDDQTSGTFQPLITANGVLMGDGNGTVTAKTLDTSSLTNDNAHVPTSGVVKSAITKVEEDIAIRVVGNKTSFASGAAIGQYVIVDGSTITGISDGLYKAARAIPYNTVIDSTYLTAVSGGGLNSIMSDSSTLRSITAARQGDTIITGGYTQFGRIVVVDFIIYLAESASANTPIVSGVPSPFFTSSASIAICGFLDAYGERGKPVILRHNGVSIVTNTDTSAGTYVFNGAYISA